MSQVAEADGLPSKPEGPGSERWQGCCHCWSSSHDGRGRKLDLCRSNSVAVVRLQVDEVGQLTDVTCPAVCERPYIRRASGVDLPTSEGQWYCKHMPRYRGWLVKLKRPEACNVQDQQVLHGAHGLQGQGGVTVRQQGGRVRQDQTHDSPDIHAR